MNVMQQCQKNLQLLANFLASNFFPASKKLKNKSEPCSEWLENIVVFLQRKVLFSKVKPFFMIK